MARTITYYIATATRQATHDAHYQCGACGYGSPVRSWAEVTHKASSTINNQESLAREASQGAQSRAAQAAVQRVESLWCPVCGQRSPSDIKRLEKMATKSYVWAGLFGLLTIACLVHWALSEFENGSWVGAIIFGVVLVLSLMQAVQKKKSARAKVVGVPQPFVQFAAAPQPQQAYPQHPQQAYPQQMR